MFTILVTPTSSINVSNDFVCLVPFQYASKYIDSEQWSSGLVNHEAAKLLRNVFVTRSI